ncbi:MAG: response regulator transcription factor [Terriglobales bacterium]|jgi:DNA-binding NarL/FixJ family response regulator
MFDRMKAASSSTSLTEKTAVLLVDDHVLVRRGFRRILDDEAHITVVGEAGDGVAAIRMAIDLKPKVVLMDCAMPIMNGLTATKKIVEACPGTLVLMLSMHSEDSLIQQAANAGARGFILKNAIDLDLGSAIRRVAAGEFLFERHVPPDVGDRRRHRDLTARETQILRLIVDGKSNTEIANLLNLSANTVGAHRYRIMSVLGVRKASELVVYAIRNGLVDMP